MPHVRGVVVLGAHDGQDLAQLVALEHAPDDDAVLHLVPAREDPPAATQESWHRLAARRFVVVLRHDGVLERPPAGIDPEAMSAVDHVARWTASHDGHGLRLMLLEPTPTQGFRICGNVEVTSVAEGIRMTLAPDAPLPDPDLDDLASREGETSAGPPIL